MDFDVTQHTDTYMPSLKFSWSFWNCLTGLRRRWKTAKIACDIMNQNRILSKNPHHYTYFNLSNIAKLCSSPFGNSFCYKRGTVCICRSSYAKISDASRNQQSLTVVYMDANEVTTECRRKIMNVVVQSIWRVAS